MSQSKSHQNTPGCFTADQDQPRSTHRVRRIRLPTLIAALLLLSAPLAPGSWHSAHAQVAPDPAVTRLIRVMMIDGAQRPSPQLVNEVYELFARAVGSSARALSHPRAINSAMQAELGAIMMENPEVRTAAMRFFRDMPSHTPAAVRNYLSRFVSSGVPAIQNSIAQNVPQQFTTLALDTAYVLSSSGQSANLATAVGQQAQSGLGAAARRSFGNFLSATGKRLGSFIEWMSSATAQRLLGIYTIADFTQSQINTALFAFQDEMEAIGDASEAEAFNNNLRLMLDSLEGGRTSLKPGMSLAEAVRQLRRNMNLGGSYFDNILVSNQVAEAKPAPGEEASCTPDIDGKYTGLLYKLSVPKDASGYGQCNDWGHWSGTAYAGHDNIPPGYWVYVAPNWYVWANKN